MMGIVPRIELTHALPLVLRTNKPRCLRARLLALDDLLLQQEERQQEGDWEHGRVGAQPMDVDAAMEAALDADVDVCMGEGAGRAGGQQPGQERQQEQQPERQDGQQHPVQGQQQPGGCAQGQLQQQVVAGRGPHVMQLYGFVMQVRLALWSVHLCSCTWLLATDAPNHKAHAFSIASMSLLTHLGTFTPSHIQRLRSSALCPHPSGLPPIPPPCAPPSLPPSLSPAAPAAALA